MRIVTPSQQVVAWPCKANFNLCQLPLTLEMCRCILYKVLALISIRKCPSKTLSKNSETFAPLICMYK